MVPEISNMLDALYTKFVLRDVVGKAIPGAIILASFSWSAGAGAWEELVDRVTKAPTLCQIAFVLACWTSGFAAQWIADQAFRLNSVRPLGDPDPKKVRSTLDRFLARARFDAYVDQLIERGHVIAEATGNAAAALLLMGTFVLIAGVETWWHISRTGHSAIWIAVGSGLVLILARVAQLTSTNARDIWEEATKRSHANGRGMERNATKSGRITERE